MEGEFLHKSNRHNEWWWPEVKGNVTSSNGFTAIRMVI